MNALAANSYSQALKNMRGLCPAPKAILTISAHWMTRGTWVTGMEKPRTIHDFAGFPEELFSIQYPAPGSAVLAERIVQALAPTSVQIDRDQWGLDHGTWSVLLHIFPEATIPVLQLSLDLSQPPEFHFELGRKLRPLREDGVLIVGSGNIVHNLRKIDWNENAKPYPWALSFDATIRHALATRDLSVLFKAWQSTEEGRLSTPTPEHYYPLLYTLGAADVDEKMQFEFEGMQHASISMTSFSFGARR